LINCEIIVRNIIVQWEGGGGKNGDIFTNGPLTHHTLTKNLKTLGLWIFSLMMLNFSNSIQCGTSPSHLDFNNLIFKCESLPNGSSPSSKNHFQSTIMQCWALELNHSYPDLSNHCHQHSLLPYIIATRYAA